MQAEEAGTFSYEAVPFNRKLTPGDILTEMCSQLVTGRFSAVVDLTWGGWVEGRMTAKFLGVPYVRIQSPNHLFMQAADDVLRLSSFEII